MKGKTRVTQETNKSECNSFVLTTHKYKKEKRRKSAIRLLELLELSHTPFLLSSKSLFSLSKSFFSFFFVSHTQTQFDLIFLLQCRCPFTNELVSSFLFGPSFLLFLSLTYSSSIRVHKQANLETCY